MSLKVHIQPILDDNYVFIIESENESAIVDPGSFEEVDQRLQQLGLQPKYILNTHHHWDHTTGNLELKKKYALNIFSSKYDKQRIPGVDKNFQDGDRWSFGNTFCDIIGVPGHTLGHIAYHFPQEEVLFVGDTLFSLGCGRLFEGSYEQMLISLKKIRELPDSTQIYCTHEYTQTNLGFSLGVDPENLELKKYAETVKKLRQQGEPTIPTELKVQKQCNPFLRADSKSLQQSLGHNFNSELECFTHLRKLRNKY